MIRSITKAVLVALSAFLAACAIITVNVYFPEKDVKQAYKSLDEMLLKTEDEKPAEQVEPKKEEAPSGQTSFLDRLPSLSLVGAAHAAAQDNVADDLAIELSSIPEVLTAYDEMKARLPQLDALRDAGAVGETAQGLVTVRDAAKAAGKETIVKAENENRKTVITGMAKAILKINKQKESKETLNQLLGKAAASYADTKREQARKGWWIQLQNGRWVQK